jgi:hypothetical protein
MPSTAALPSSAPWRRDQHPGAFSFASGGLSPFAADWLADRDAPLGHRHSCMHPAPAWRLPTAGHFPAMLFFLSLSRSCLTYRKSGTVQVIIHGSRRWCILQHEYSVAARVVAMTTVVMPNIQMPTTAMVIYTLRPRTDHI